MNYVLPAKSTNNISNVDDSSIMRQNLENRQKKIFVAGGNHGLNEVSAHQEILLSALFCELRVIDLKNNVHRLSKFDSRHYSVLLLFLG